MQLSSIPPKFPIPFANSAGAGYIRSIPTASQIGIQNGAASLTDGFPPLCFLSVGTGGTPPFGEDFNGLFNQITAWLRWIQAGGIPQYDGTFSAAIGGYPNGAVLVRAAGGGFWISTVDNNTSDPDTGGGNWVASPSLTPYLGVDWEIDTANQLRNNGTTMFMGNFTSGGGAINSGSTVTLIGETDAQIGSNFSINGSGQIVVATPGIYEVTYNFTIYYANPGTFNFYPSISGGELIGPTSTYPVQGDTASATGPYAHVTVKYIFISGAANQATWVTSATAFGSGGFQCQGYAQALIRAIG